MALLGSRAPTALKLLLMTIAIVDDVGAVVIIALFYTGALHWGAVGAGVAVLGVMWAAEPAWGENPRGLFDAGVRPLGCGAGFRRAPDHRGRIDRHHDSDPGHAGRA
jgi:hypothetical protein